MGTINGIVKRAKITEERLVDQVKSIKEAGREFTTRLWNRDFSVVEELVDSDIVFHSMLGEFHGKEALLDVAETWLKAFPDMHLTILIAIAENETVSIQWNVKATHLGEFKMVAPTGKPVNYSGTAVYRFKEGKIIEFWSYLDLYDLMHQIQSGTYP